MSRPLPWVRLERDFTSEPKLLEVCAFASGSTRTSDAVYVVQHLLRDALRFVREWWDVWDVCHAQVAR